jgi:hypothetical protein
VQDRLQAIVVLGLHVGDFFQCSLELLPVEEFCTGLDILPAGKPICKHSGHKLFNGDVVLGGNLSGTLVQVLGAAILLLISPLFLSSAKTRAVSSPGCQTAPRRQNA